MKKPQTKMKNKDMVAIIVVIILIFAYVTYQCYSVFHVGLQTQTAVTTTVYETIDAKALFVRDEHIIKKSGSSVVMPVVNDGDKVNVGGNVAVTFSSESSANSYSKYLELSQELEYYEKLDSSSVGQATSVESVNRQIDEHVNKYIQSLYDNDDIGECADNINGSLIQRQLIIGKKIDFSSITKNLRKQMEKEASSVKTAGYITTDESGVFSSYTDGYEKLISYDKATEQSIKNVKNAIKKAEKSNGSAKNAIGKLVTSYNWYMEMVLPASQIRELNLGKTITVALKNNDAIVFDAEIVSGAEPDIGAKETLLVLKCNRMDAELASLRMEEVELRYKSYDGIKVPMEALHVVNGKKGVYALISNQVQFRKANVIYSEDDWVLLSYNKDDKDGIRLYDKIIIQGKDLKNGKVYT